MGALVGPDGVFIVDSQSARITDQLVAVIRQYSDAPLRYMVITHHHGDHSGGIENFAKLGVSVMARPAVRARLAQPTAPADRLAPPPPPLLALPALTYDSRMTIHMNGEAIELIPLWNAHTDGDTAIRFAVADVLMTGDVYRSIGFPHISDGGTLEGMLAALAVLDAAAGPNTKVLPGHGPIVDRAAITAHRDMAIVIRDRVAQMVAQGRTLEQVLEAKPTADYDEPTGSVAGSAERYVRKLY